MVNAIQREYREDIYWLNQRSESIIGMNAGNKEEGRGKLPAQTRVKRNGHRKGAAVKSRKLTTILPQRSEACGKQVGAVEGRKVGRETMPGLCGKCVDEGSDVRSLGKRLEPL